MHFISSRKCFSCNTEDIRKTAVKKIISIKNKSLRSSNAEKAANFWCFFVPAISVNMKVY